MQPLQKYMETFRRIKLFQFKKRKFDWCWCFFSLNWPTGPIQSLSRNVHKLSVCVCVQSRKPRFPVDWRLMDKEDIANIGIPLDILGFLLSQ